MKITNTRVNHIVNPMGYRIEAPVFTYVVEEANGKKQTAARIRVAADAAMTQILADTGVGNLNSLGTKLPMQLSPRTRYYWTVEAESDAGEKAVSEVSYFETAKMEEPWAGKWIGADKTKERHPIFGKAFALPGIAAGKEIASARLYISGLGLYNAKINGQEVTKEKLTPYCTDYSEWVQYQTYDVAPLLAADNTVSVMVGRGWYSGRFGFSAMVGDGGFFGDEFMIIAELHVVYADGSEDLIATDDSWTVTRSNYTFSNLYDGEHRDDTLAPTEIEAVYYTAPKGELTARMSIPVYAQEELPAQELIHTPAGEKVFDLGQNMAGGFRLWVDVPAGTRVHIQTGEILVDGNFYNENLRTALSEYFYISDGTPKYLEPMFTFFGYRFAKVEGIDNLKKEDFTGIPWYSDFNLIGELTTGDAKLNKLLCNIAWGQKGNFIDVPTDCPQRDERMGWTADTQVFVPTACFMTDSTAFYRKFLYDLRQEQKTRNGCVPDVVPSCGVEGGCSVWGDAATIIPWTLYLYTGDKSILEESLDSMAAWVDYITNLDGDTHHWREVFHYGDWLALDSIYQNIDSVKGGTEWGYIADVYYMHSAEMTAQAAELVGNEAYVTKYSALAARIRQDIEDEFFTKNGRCAINTQTAYILALRHHLTSDPAKIVKHLVENVRQHGYKLATGFTGTPFLTQELSKAGENKLAFKLLHNEEYPGWLYEVNLGATTVWERWNSLSPDGTVSSTGMNSFNHYAYGSIAEWMWKTIGGINPDAAQPGFKRAVLRPTPDRKIGSASAVYHSAAGTYRTEWKVIDEDRKSVV